VNLFYQPNLPDGIHFLEADESRHCVKVLRANAGDRITVTDGKGTFYECIITKADAAKCIFQVESTRVEKPRPHSIHIAIAPTKSPDRIEWFTEKAVELGIDTITLMQCEHSEKGFLKTERLMKVAVSAMKQSLKATLPKIVAPTPFEQVITLANASQKFIAFVDSGNPRHLKDVARRNDSALVLIGPEGDFSPAELQMALSSGYEKVSLGSSRLRTETAGIAACHILNLING
jgi:16S rRNA (uracil1498-N3)-methyltransferase